MTPANSNLESLSQAKKHQNQIARKKEMLH